MEESRTKPWLNRDGNKSRANGEITLKGRILAASTVAPPPAEAAAGRRKSATARQREC